MQLYVKVKQYKSNLVGGAVYIAATGKSRSHTPNTKNIKNNNNNKMRKQYIGHRRYRHHRRRYPSKLPQDFIMAPQLAWIGLGNMGRVSVFWS